MTFRHKLAAAYLLIIILIILIPVIILASPAILYLVIMEMIWPSKVDGRKLDVYSQKLDALGRKISQK